MSGYIYNFISYAGSSLYSACKSLVLTEDGKELLEKRTEHATTVLLRAKCIDKKPWYLSNISKIFSSKLLAIDPSSLRQESLEELSSGTDDPEIRRPFRNFQHMINVTDKSPLSWVLRQDAKALQDRKLLSKHMGYDRFQALGSLITIKIQKEIESFKRSPPACLYAWAHQLSLEIICEHVLGITYVPPIAHQTLDDAEIAIVRETEPVTVFGYDITFTDSQKRYKQAKIAFIALANEFIDRNEAVIQSNVGFLNTLLNQLAKEKGLSLDKAIKEKEVRHILASAAAGLLFAGGTLSTTLTIGLLHLDNFRGEQLGSDEMLEAYFKEAVRYTSSAAHNLRYISKEKELHLQSGKTLTVPKNTFIVIDHRASHQDTARWQNPHLFIPERFLASNSPKIDTSDFSPFSLGSRGCPGKSLAKYIFKTIVGTLAKERITIVTQDKNVKDIGNEQYWTSKDFVTRLRNGNLIKVTIRF